MFSLATLFFSPLPVAEEFTHVFNPLKVKGMDLPRAQHCLAFE